MKMILVNTNYISGKELEMLGLVKGSTIQSKNIGRDITQMFKTLVGGELKAYNEMMNEARALATKRMVEEAEKIGADAVVNIRYASASVMQGAAEIMAYGTAVKFKFFWLNYIKQLYFCTGNRKKNGTNLHSYHWICALAAPDPRAPHYIQVIFTIKYYN